MRTFIFPCAAAVSLLALSACNGESGEAEPTETSEEVSGRTVAALLAGTEGLSTAGDAFVDAGLGTALDGNASYTVFVPTDAAFEALEQTTGQLEGEEGRAAMAAVLRDHIVPGFVTRDDIARAIAASKDGSATLQTVTNHPLVFTADGEAITITSADGTEAKIAGPVRRGPNGVTMPIDAVLKSLPEAS